MKLSNEEQLAIVQTGRDDLVSFAMIQHGNYEVNWHHELIAEYLEKVESNEIDRLMIFVPPRHGKSQLSSIYFPAWYLGRNPDKEIVVTSYSSDIAQEFGSKAREEIRSDTYRYMFPEIRLKQDTQAKSYWNVEYVDDNKWEVGGSYKSVGIGGSLTGRGANVLLIDDPVKDAEQAHSDTYQQKVWNWYNSVASTRLEKDGAVILIMTRWHENDLAGRLLNEGVDDWTVLTIPAIAEEDGSFRKEGEAIWEDKISKERILNIKKQDLYTFNALYQQNPISEESSLFKRSYFRTFEENEIPSDVDIKILVDPAISQKKEACNSAIVAVAKSINDPRIFVLDYRYGKFDPLEIIRNIEAMHKKMEVYGRPVDVFVEGVAYQEAIQYYLEERMRKTGYYMNVDTFRDPGSKEMRIKGLLPHYRMGEMYHRDWMVELEDELVKYPNGKTVDIVDALSFFTKLEHNTVYNAQLVEQLQARGKKKGIHKSFA